ncbi:MAG: sigma 54-interacting transcriptional regulator [Planctomycetota bacterium]
MPAARSITSALVEELLAETRDERDLGRLLDRVVAHLARTLPVVLARTWLLRPGDRCGTCTFAAFCPDRSRCLHLVASAGCSTHLEGRFARIPIGLRKIGAIAARREAVELDLEGGDRSWLADPTWAEREGVRGFVGQPLIWKGELLGVLGLFLRVPLVRESATWSRVVADQAAASVATSRALAEIEQLRDRLAAENRHLREELAPGELIGQGPAARTLKEQLALVAGAECNVLLLGESGTGKELVARAIHADSPRARHALVRVNCAAIPEALFESEFFGHARGAFTGAERERLGRFELAHQGTIFLDEVSELPLALQGKLLRVLQEGTFERVGESTPRTTDARVLAATNRDLEAEVEAGRFRQDLFYRLSVFPLRVPPLRERAEDIPRLVEHFVAGRAEVPPGELAQLVDYDWPGNVRELENVVERAVVLARGGPLRFDLPARRPRRRAARPLTWAESQARERQNVLDVLERVGWKVAGEGGAAEYLGVHPATLRSRLKAWGIRRS